MVPALMSWLSCSLGPFPGDLRRLADLGWACRSCPVPDALSWLSSPAVLSWLTCASPLVPSPPVAAVLFCSGGPFFSVCPGNGPVNADRSLRPVQTGLPQRSRLRCTFQPRLSHPSCPVLVVLPLPSCSSHPVISIRSWLYLIVFSECPIMDLCPSSPISTVC